MSLPKFSLPKFSLPKFSLPKFSPSLQPLSSAPVVPRLSLALVALASLATLLTTGCSTSFEPTPIAPVTPITTPSSSSTIEGKVHGGNQPISGAAVYLYAASTTGYGGAGIAASTTNASKSLLTVLSGVVGVGTTKDSNGNYYVTTRSDGSFSLGGSYVCTVGQQVYLYVVGGNTGAGGVNTASGLLAALGQCPSGGSLSTTVPYVWVNEVTTIATAYALAGFATDATHIGTSGSALAATGIANAFLNVTNLVNIATGTAYTKTLAGNSPVPQTTINALANTLAACVNTATSTSSTCNSLLTTALAAGATGAQPTDTATAAINIAHYPGNAVSTLFGLPSGIGAPFQPTLPSSPVPNDLTLSLAFTGTGLGNPYSIAIDASGNAWVSDVGSITKLSSLGAVASGTSGYPVGALGSVGNIAFDNAGALWLTVPDGAAIGKMSSSGSLISGAYTGGGLNGGFTMATDAGGNVWVSSFNFVPGVPNSSQPYSADFGLLSKFSNSGTPISGSNGYSKLSANGEYGGIAVDGSGNLWAAIVSSSNYNYTGGLAQISSAGSTQAEYYSSTTVTPYAIAVDSAGNVWTTYYNINTGASSSIIERSNAGSLIGTYTAPSISYPYAIAIDGAGNAWSASGGNALVTEVASSGTILSGTNGFSPVGLTQGYLRAFALAVDGSGDVWIVSESNGTTGTVTEMIGAATPVITPLVAGLPSTPTPNGTSNLGTRP